MMVQFIQRQEDPSVRIGQLLGGVAERGMQGYEKGKAFAMNEEDRKRLEKHFSTQFSIDPAIRKEQIKELMKAERKKSELESLSNLMGNKGNKGSKATEPKTSSETQTQGLSDFDYDLDSDIDADLPDPMLKYTLGSINPTLGSIAAREESDIRKDIREERKYRREKPEKEAQKVLESDKINAPFVNKTIDAYEMARNKENILMRLDQLDHEGELSEPALINALDQVGLNREWIRNAANDEYQKLALDLLGGGTLQTDYGARVLASEFATSLKRIPDLLQTAEGRKQIKENLRFFLLPSKLKFERMQYYLDKSDRENKPLPRNFRAKILEDIRPQLDEAAEKFKERNGRYKYPKNTSISDQILEKYYYLSNGNKEKAFKMMQEDGLNVD